ncbi:MAG TPA: ABC transporter permease [Puia sp.]|jgi:predicted permease|nr:ABC transporter permease [Puia sp.]
MLKNYFVIALRQLRSNGTNSFLNIFGLAVGIACAGLIFLWVEDEVHFDSYNVKKDRVYLVKVNSTVDGGVFTHSSTPQLLAPLMQADIPGVAATCRSIEGPMPLLLNPGDKPVYSAGLFIDSSVFELFTLPFAEGNAASAFKQLHSLVLTEKSAKKLFGKAQGILGRTIRVDNKQDYVVTGVVKDVPENASLQFEWLAPFEINIQANPGNNNWNAYGTTTYVELKPGVDPAVVNRQLYNFLQEKSGDASLTSRAFLFGMDGWRLYNQFDNGRPTGGGRIEYVRLFSVIAWIILLIACVNFMNLATARSEKRAREVGVRKVLGAVRAGLFVQFVGEAIMLAALAALAAVLVMLLVLPAFNGLVQKNLTLGFGAPAHWLLLGLTVLVCGLIAGSYPALYLSAFRPVSVLKGMRVKAGSASLIRKGLVILQFTTSIVLIIGTVVIFQQVQHVKSRDLGFRKDGLMQLDLQGDMRDKFMVIRQDLINTGLVANAALADHETIYSGNNTTAMMWPGKDPKSKIVISQRLISPEYMSTVGMRIAEGRDFQQTDQRNMGSQTPIAGMQGVFPVIVTESMAKIMGHGSVIGRYMTLMGNGANFQLQVVGVVKDYIYGNMYVKSAPVVFYCLPDQATLMYVRLKPGIAAAPVLSKMETVLRKDNPGYPFQYRFVEDQFNQLFMDELLMSRLSGIFAGLAILISCLGLFGLAAYTAERRTKEIGIRKVLGASAARMARLLSADFLRLVVASCVIAFPVAWWVMQDWLKAYAYRIDLQWWVFLAAGGVAVVIALGTVSWQALRAAMANPVKSIRTQ